MHEHFDEDFLAGFGGEIDHLGAGGGLGEPVLELEIFGDVAVFGVVGVDERGEECTEFFEDGLCVGEEGEGFEF